MCVIKAMAPACFPEQPAPGRAWQAMSMGHRAGSPWQSEEGWAPLSRTRSSKFSLACVRLSSLGDGWHSQSRGFGEQVSPGVNQGQEGLIQH